MKLRIDLNSATPAYRQITDSIRILLVDRNLKPGDRLPSARHLALDLGIHFNTVAEAYRILADEGWLDVKRRRGATVISRPTPRRAKTVSGDGFTARLRALVAEVQAAGTARSRIARELRTLAEGLDR